MTPHDVVYAYSFIYRIQLRLDPLRKGFDIWKGINYNHLAEELDDMFSPSLKMFKDTIKNASNILKKARKKKNPTRFLIENHQLIEEVLAPCERILNRFSSYLWSNEVYFLEIEKSSNCPLLNIDAIFDIWEELNCYKRTNNRAYFLSKEDAEKALNQLRSSSKNGDTFPIRNAVCCQEAIDETYGVAWSYPLLFRIMMNRPYDDDNILVYPSEKGESARFFVSCKPEMFEHACAYFSEKPEFIYFHTKNGEGFYDIIEARSKLTKEKYHDNCFRFHSVARSFLEEKIQEAADSRLLREKQTPIQLRGNNRLSHPKSEIIIKNPKPSEYLYYDGFGDIIEGYLLPLFEVLGE